LGKLGNSGIEKIIALGPSSTEDLHPLDLTEKENVKAEYAKGKEYFFADVAGAGEEQVIALLRSFSLFKKRQRSGLQLVIAGGEIPGLMGKLETYKYRQDLHWHRLTTEASRRCMAAAYAALLLFDGESLGRPVLDAWKTGVPLVIHPNDRLQEIAGNAALLADDGEPAAFGRALMSLYKDEALRSDLIKQGFLRLDELSSLSPVAQVKAAIARMQIIN
jgi:glycosyltransferase involved in cell wall biosynthesis